MNYFYNTSTGAVVTYDTLKETYPMFSWPKDGSGQSVDQRLLMSSIHPDILFYKRLINEEPPTTTRYQKVVRKDPAFIEEQWSWGWEIVEIDSDARQLQDASLIESMKQYRDEDWHNATISLSNGAILQINERTRRDIQDTLTGLITLGLNEYAGWNAVNGIFTLTVSDIQEAIVKALLRVKKSFDAYNHIVGLHAITPYEDDSWIEDFNNFEPE
jgi:hypothetical protein